MQELIARLTKTRIKVHNTSTNATLDDNDTTFPLGHSLYVDATHEVVFLNGNLNTQFQSESVTRATNDHLDSRSVNRIEFDEFCVRWPTTSRPHTEESQIRCLSAGTVCNKHANSR